MGSLALIASKAKNYCNDQQRTWIGLDVSLKDLYHVFYLKDTILHTLMFEKNLDIKMNYGC